MSGGSGGCKLFVVTGRQTLQFRRPAPRRSGEVLSSGLYQEPVAKVKVAPPPLTGSQRMLETVTTLRAKGPISGRPTVQVVGSDGRLVGCETAHSSG